MQKIRFVCRRQLSDCTWEYIFTPVEFHPDYLPGQYAEFSFLNGNRRVMTLTSHPSEANVISFATRFNEPLSDYKNGLVVLSPGDEMQVGAPLGDFVLPRSADTPLVFVAGGIGIASYISLLKDIRQSQKNREVHLLYSLRSPTDFSYRELIDSFPFTSKREYISPNHVTPKDILSSTKNDQSTLYYLSGTERFVESLRHDLEASGLDHTQIVFDFFTGY